MSRFLFDSEWAERWRHWIGGKDSTQLQFLRAVDKKSTHPRDTFSNSRSAVFQMD